MQTRLIKIKNPHGLHLRASAELVKSASRYKSKITLCNGCACADSCSILQVMSLGVGPDAEVKVTVNGPDEQAAMRAIAELFSEGGGI